MKTSDFYYDLPKELIAQDPLEDRSSSRLLHLSMKDGSIEHRHFTDILEYLHEGDCLVINDTRVIPARLYGHKEETGALIEILLLKRKENDTWECLVKPGKKARPGARITFGDGILKGEILDIIDEGNRLIRFEYDGIFEEILDQLGEMPLPPYITHKLKDKNPVPDCLREERRVCGGANRRPSFHGRTPEKGGRERREDRPCDPPCGTWNFPAGKGGRRGTASYAFRILRR